MEDDKSFLTNASIQIINAMIILSMFSFRKLN